MKIVLTVPVPLDTPEVWQTFRPFIQRWCDSYRRFRPKVEHEVVPVNCHESHDCPVEVSDCFKDISSHFFRYDGKGTDIGAGQKLGAWSQADLVIATTSRCYFWKKGWLEAFVKAVEKHGEGLYGAAASLEANSLIPDVFPNPHLRTVFYGMSSKMWREYPHRIENREQAYLAESGEWSLTAWAEAMGYPVKQVTWDGVWDRKDWAKVKNRFRDGSQHNLLIRDKHIDAFDKADETTKRLWRKRAWGTA